MFEATIYEYQYYYDRDTKTYTRSGDCHTKKYTSRDIEELIEQDILKDISLCDWKTAEVVVNID